MATVSSSNARFQNLSEDQLARAYASAKGWRTWKIRTIQHMIEKVIAMKSDLAPDHNRESQKFEREFQKMVTDTFDLSHGKYVNTFNRLSIATGAGAGPIISAPQLPVLALKPNYLPIIFNVHSTLKEA